MKADKITLQLEKMIEKLEGISPSFSKSENQNEFEANKGDVIALLNEMVELAHDDTDEDEEE